MPQLWHAPCHGAEGVGMARKRAAGTGATRKLPSGRWQARFRGPDGMMRPAPVTFDTKMDASAWLSAQVDAVEQGNWTRPDAPSSNGRQTLKQYADT